MMEKYLLNQKFLIKRNGRTESLLVWMIHDIIIMNIHELSRRYTEQVSPYPGLSSQFNIS